MNNSLKSTVLDKVINTLTSNRRLLSEMLADALEGSDSAHRIQADITQIDDALQAIFDNNKD